MQFLLGLPLPCQHILTLMNSIINNQETFKQIYLYIILTKGINITFLDPKPTYLVFKRVHFTLHINFKKFNTQREKLQQ